MKPFLVLVLVLAAVAALFFAVRFLTQEEGGSAAGPQTQEVRPQNPSGGARIEKPVDASSAVPVENRTPPTATDPSSEPTTARANTLSGLVVDANNKGVPDATVILTQNAMMGEAIAGDWFMGRTAPRGTPRQTKTDAQGNWKLKDVDPARDYYVVVQHTDFSPAQEAGVAVGDEGDFRAPDVVLRAGSTLIGLVMDETGNGIANATLHLDSAYVMSDDPKSPDRMTTETNGGGRYEFKNVAAGPRNLTAQAEGFGLQIKSNLMFKGEPTDSQSQDFKLQPGRPIAGRVLVQGTSQGLKGVRVVALNYNNNVSSRGEAISGDDGAFQIDGLQSGAYQMSVEDVPCYRATKVNRVAADDMNVLIELAQRASVSGRVIDANGKPVPSFAATGRRISAGQGKTLYENMDDKTVIEGSADGSFQLCNFDPGTYEIMVTSPGHAPGFSEKFTVEQNSSVPNLVVRLGSGGSMRGRVVDSSGNPIQGAIVSSHDNEMGDDFLDPMLAGLLSTNATERKTRSDRDGNFELKLLAPAEYQIMVVHPKYTRARVQSLRVVEGQQTDAGPIKMSAGGSVSGKVYDQAGRPVTRGFVQLISSSDPSLSFQARTDVEGRYVVPHVPAGTYELWATRNTPDGGPDPFVTIAEQQGSRVTISVIEGQEMPRDLNLGG